MTPNEYQEAAARTLVRGDQIQIDSWDARILWNAIGISGEAGEVCEQVKKMIFHEQGLDRDKLASELGDVLWYVSALATCLDLKLEDIMAKNIGKLVRRHPNGWDPTRASGGVNFTS